MEVLIFVTAKIKTTKKTMKKHIVKYSFLIIAVIALLPLMSKGQGTMGPGFISATLDHTAHDFSDDGWNYYNPTTQVGGQICQPCHTPHNAINTLDAPLWNHRTSTAAYQMYTSANSHTFGSSPATVPDGTSKLCLACHDGTVAMRAFGSQLGAGYLTGGTLLATDLRNDHPISFVYDSIAAGGVWATSHIYSGTKTIQSLLDANGKMQCTTCHDQHNNSVGYYLRLNNVGSNFCKVCHKK